MITGIELLALGIVDAQVEGIAVHLFVAALSSVAEVLEGLQTLEARQAAHHGQDSRMEGSHQVTGFLEAERSPPEREQLDQFIDEVFARFAGESHHRHRTQLESQVLRQQHNAQHQRCRLARTGAGDHRCRRRITENHLPLRSARLSVRRQESGNVGLHALFQLGG
ncbi:hypothetical protein D3C86_1530880 [compost metagenome]